MAAETAPLKVDFSITHGDKKITKSQNKIYSEEIVMRKTVDNSDSGVIVISFNDSAFLGSSLKNAKALLVCNEGDVSAEIDINVATWTHGTPDTNASGLGTDMKKVLNAGEFFYMPNLALFKFSASNSAAQGAVLDNQVPSATFYIDSGVNLDGDLEDTETGVQVADIAPFEVGDLIQVGINDTTATRIEIMEITSITDDSGTDDDGTGILNVKRALFGTSKADKDSQTDGTNGAVSGANVYFPIFNAYYDYNHKLSGSSQLNMSDGLGRYKIHNFWGYGRSAVADDEVQGIVPGSVAIKFYESAYHEIDFAKPITGATDTKLAVSTAYSFDLTIDDSAATNLAFTTDSSITRFSGPNGVLAKIQEAIDTATQTAGGNLFGYSATASIIGGKLRITSNSHMAPHDGTNGSRVLIEDASSGTDLLTGSVGIFPDDADMATPVEPALPLDEVIDQATGRSNSNYSKFMYDDGHGRLIYNGAVVGEVGYLTGACRWTIPSLPHAQFVINGAYDSALSGGVKIKATHADTGIGSILARSMNNKINTVIGVYAFN